MKMKLLIWGMGSGAKKFLENIRSGKDKYKAIGITDSFVQEGSEESCGGVSVFAPQIAIGLEYDYVVVCSRYHVQEIRKNLQKMGVNRKKILSNIDFYQTILFGDQHLAMLKNNKLYDLFVNTKHSPSEKWFHYFNVYDHFFRKFIDTDVVICEIGVKKGGSVQLWEKYFGEKATIIGIDIDEECRQYETEHIRIEIGSQDNPEFWEYFKKKYPQVDILLDDGGHTMEQQILTFESMFSHIADGGIYLCEDVHTSYWEEYSGGYHKGTSYIEYTKQFIDDIHANYIESGELEPNYNTHHMYGIHYYDSMVVVEKQTIGFPFVIYTYDEDENK